jgi:hypothetical protein
MDESYVNNILKSVSYVFLVYANDVSVEAYMLIGRNKEISVVASKEIGLEVNTEKTKYMVMSREQNAGQNHNIKM